MMFAAIEKMLGKDVYAGLGKPISVEAPNTKMRIVPAAFFSGKRASEKTSRRH